MTLDEQVAFFKKQSAARATEIDRLRAELVAASKRIAELTGEVPVSPHASEPRAS
jgi:hypothetical protein